jgi:hypothetical protein
LFIFIQLTHITHSLTRSLSAWSNVLIEGKKLIFMVHVCKSNNKSTNEHTWMNFIDLTHPLTLRPSHLTFRDKLIDKKKAHSRSVICLCLYIVNEWTVWLFLSLSQIDFNLYLIATSCLICLTYLIILFFSLFFSVCVVGECNRWRRYARVGHFHKEHNSRKLCR